MTKILAGKRSFNKMIFHVFKTVVYDQVLTPSVNQFEIQEAYKALFGIKRTFKPGWKK